MVNIANCFDVITPPKARMPGGKKAGEGVVADALLGLGDASGCGVDNTALSASAPFSSMILAAKRTLFLAVAVAGVCDGALDTAVTH